jgi:hypothetical protein
MSGCTDEAVTNVQTLINGIGTVTLESGDSIEKAEAAYTALSDTQKRKVDNYSELVNVHTEYNDLRVNHVIDLIDSIGTPTIDSYSEITAAEKSYAELPSELQSKIINVDLLVGINETYNNLLAQRAIDSIKNIGTVSLDSLSLITAAEDEYKSLSIKNQTLVSNYDVLVAARSKYDKLEKKAEKKAEEKAAKIAARTIDGWCYVVKEASGKNEGYSSYIVGTLRNDSGRLISSAYVNFNIYQDSNLSIRVDSTVDSIRNWEPGTEWKFKCYVSYRGTYWFNAYPDEVTGYK